MKGWLRRFLRVDRVSDRWLREQERLDGSRGLDQVSIKWPIKKLTNEHALWNRHQDHKRKRA